MGELISTVVVATHIPPALGYGGVPVTAAILTRAWNDAGHKIVLVASDESISGTLSPEQIDLGENVKVQLFHCYWFRRWGFGLGAIPKLYRLLRRTDQAYIHGIATWPTTLAGIFCVLFGRRFIVAVHGGLMPEHLSLIRRSKLHKWFYYKILTFPILRRAIAVHCTSETEVEGVRSVLGTDARILLIPNGIDCSEIAKAGRPLGSGITICFLGHIQKEKGINAFVRIWLSCRGKRDRLVVAGHSVDARYLEEFNDLVRQSEGAIIYRGYLNREEVMDLLANSHFLVLPSGLEEAGGMRENFGNVVAEALAVGRPVLVAKGLAWDHIESVGAGLIFERSEDSVRSTTSKALTYSADDWEVMSSNARSYVEGHLDSMRLGEQVWSVLVGRPAASLSKESLTNDWE